MKRVYPPLSSGSLAQWGSRKTSRQTRAQVQFLDGTTGFGSSLGNINHRWHLPYTGLTLEEATRLQAFYQDCGGRRETFVFVDPFGNALQWSEDLTQAVWQTNPFLRVIKTDIGQVGQIFQLLNTSQVDQSIHQQLNVPATTRFINSVYVRADAATTVQLSGVNHPVGSSWRRICAASSDAISAETQEFRFVVPAGATVNVTGLQSEVGRSCSTYQKSEAQGGVFPQGRFDQDQLSITTTTDLSFATAVHIIAQAN